MFLGIIELFIAVFTLSIALYYYLTWTYDFWTIRGVAGPKPEILFGNARDLATRRTPFPLWVKDLYKKYRNEPMFGVYLRRDPALIVNDLNLAKTVLIRDFNSFSERALKPDIHDPLSYHLVALEAERWKPLRLKLSSVFTPGKIREMFYLMNECGDRLEKYLDVVDGRSINIREIAARFTTDVIGRCVFGLDAEAIEKEDSIFRKMGRKAVDIDWKVSLRMRMMEFVPGLYKLIGGLLADKTLHKFFTALTRDTIKYREENNVMKHDFVDLLRDLRKEKTKSNDLELTDSLMAAQLFVFFVAGFEASSLAMSNCLLELAMNQEIQGKLRQEVLGEIEEANGKITFEGIERMKYLDKVVKETLRKYTPAPLISRTTTEVYTFEGTNVTLPVNTRVYIPIYGIQNDPKYFPEPDVFNPENFSEEAVNRRPHMSFLAFGDGPRNCIGKRFGSMQTKLGIVKVLQKYTVDVCEKTDKEYKIDAKSFFLIPANGIFIKIAKRTST